MIELTPLARPYAKALFASAIESNTLEDMAVELNTMAVASLEDGVINTIENPTLSRQEIVDILVKLFDDSISETSKKLLSILANIERSFFDVSEILSSNNFTKISTISCLDNVGFSIVFITPSSKEATAIVFNSTAISSKVLDSIAEANSAFAYGLASGVSSIIFYSSSAAFFKIASCFSFETSSPRIF